MDDIQDDNQSVIIENNAVKKFQEWSKETDNIVCTISDYSKCMARLCIYVSEHHQRMRTYLLGPAAVLSWALTIFGMFATYYGNKKIPDPTVILINSLLNFIIATFTTVAEKSQAGSKIELFQQLARDFFNLSGTISMELSKEPCCRLPVSPFVTNMNLRYKDLENSVPPLPQALLTAFTLYMEEIDQTHRQDIWRKIDKPNMLSPLSPTYKYDWTKDLIEPDVLNNMNYLKPVKKEHDVQTELLEKMEYFKKMERLQEVKQDHDEETGEALKEK